jgi:hypothetical protein
MCISTGKWQSDIVGISFARSQISIGPEVTIPSDSRPLALSDGIVACDRKLKSYRPLRAALQDYVNSEWAPCVYVFSRRWLEHEE